MTASEPNPFQDMEPPDWGWFWNWPFPLDVLAGAAVIIGFVVVVLMYRSKKKGPQ